MALPIDVTDPGTIFAPVVNVESQGFGRGVPAQVNVGALAEVTGRPAVTVDGGASSPIRGAVVDTTENDTINQTYGVGQPRNVFV